MDLIGSIFELLIPIEIAALTWFFFISARRAASKPRACRVCKHQFAPNQLRCPECGNVDRVELQIAARWSDPIARQRSNSAARERIVRRQRRAAIVTTVVMGVIALALSISVYFSARSAMGLPVPEWAAAPSFVAFIDVQVAADDPQEALDVQIQLRGLAIAGPNTAAGAPPATLLPTEIGAGVIARMGSVRASPAGVAKKAPRTSLGFVQTDPNACTRSGQFGLNPTTWLFRLPLAFSERPSWQLGYFGPLEQSAAHAVDWITQRIADSPGAATMPTRCTSAEARRIASAVIALRETPGGVPWTARNETESDISGVPWLIWRVFFSARHRSVAGATPQHARRRDAP